MTILDYRQGLQDGIEEAYNPLRAMLDAYRNGERGLPTYAELAHMVGRPKEMRDMRGLRPVILNQESSRSGHRQG